MMTTTSDRPALRLPGQNKDNPLLALLNGVTPKQVQEIDDEIEIARAYLDKLEKLRDVVSYAPGGVRPTVVVDESLEPIPQLPAAAKPDPEPEPPAYVPPPRPKAVERDDEDTPPIRPGEGVLGGDDDDDDGDEEETPASPPPPPRVSRDTDVQWKDLDKKRRTVAEYIFKKGFAPQRKIVADCQGIGGRNVAAVMNHGWFERFKTGGEEVWRLTQLGKREGVTL